MINIQIKRMWTGGPLRQFSDRTFKDSITVEGGHAGHFICDVYGHITADEGQEAGVSLINNNWLCFNCGERRQHDLARADARIKRALVRTNLSKSAKLGGIFEADAQMPLARGSDPSVGLDPYKTPMDSEAQNGN